MNFSKGKNNLVISYDVGQTGKSDLNYNGFGFDLKIIYFFKNNFFYQLNFIHNYSF